MARANGGNPQPLGVTPSGVDVIDRAMALLFAFRKEDRSLTLSELAKRSGLYKSTALRLAAALCHHRMMIRLEDGRYSLGSATFSLGNHYLSNLNLSDVLLPLMRELNERLGETISFHIREDDHRLCLFRINSQFSVRVNVQQGDVQSLERGAGGRILLAFSGEPGEIYDRVRGAYSYASLGERDEETAGISAPVFGADLQLIGALGIVAPLSRLDMALMAQYRPVLLDIAARATERLGGDALPLLRAKEIAV
ncbi:IclR family transcriptional regulator [Acerihabitans arboris]|uniref:Helix-turn-helix domain-containing protein n=1 Tax=Acerihabitans arboris TaxID=2691583 RepID=A0A845SK03_9GAMM|nr:IclR family transcriptional regulator [Acerihabitans arboris]NDL63326.1 helix-turn-helix domain-containing protein [Acerihabitans arboris]